MGASRSNTAPIKIYNLTRASTDERGHKTVVKRILASKIEIFSQLRVTRSCLLMISHIFEH